MKKNYFSLLFVFASFISQAQIVSIPDAAFKTRLLNSDVSNITATNSSGSYFAIDSNSDGEIQESEALQVKKLTLGISGISDLTGIRNFTNLRELSFVINQVSNLDLHGLNQLEVLDCSRNSLQSLDVTYLTNLKSLTCSASNVHSLNVAGMSNLEELICNSNQLTSLNLTGLTHLTNLQTGSNQLHTINVNHLTSLKYLTCEWNSLTSIDMSNLSNLEVFYIKGNSFNTVDITHNPKIYWFDCSYNQLTSIDLSHSTKLTNAVFQSNLLTELDLSHCTAISGSNHQYRFEDNPNLNFVSVKNGVPDYIYFNTSQINCPNLHYICADDVDMDNLTSAMQHWGVTGIQANTYCNFTPGGDYNTITGSTTIDSNGYGCDANDFHMPNVRIDLTDGANNSSTFTNASGNYDFYNLTGNFTLTPTIKNPGFFAFTPSSVTLNFPTLNNSTQTQHFCITPIGAHTDIEVVLIPLTRFRPGFDCVFKLVYKNNGNHLIPTGYINFGFNDDIFTFVTASPANSAQIADNLHWDYSNLLPFESRTITFTLHLNSPTETPAVNIGDILNFAVQINPIVADENQQDNICHLTQTVVGSLDPNDKICLEGNSITPDKVGDYLNYVIRFQNSGNHFAENVVVKDVIDTSKFDISSLQLIASSHPHSTRITGNKAEFIFENINLPSETDNEPGSHGFVAFKIKTKNTLVLGDQIQNAASIYFDFNAPITTDTANTRVALLNIHENETNTVSVSPIPVKDVLHIKALQNITSVEVFDMQGRLLQSKTTDGLSVTIDLTGKSKGVYLIKVYTLKGIKVQKIIKE